MFFQLNTSHKIVPILCVYRKLRRGGVSSGSLTYTGKKLREKGILVDIRDFTASQYSSVAFVIGRVETGLSGPQGRGKGNSFLSLL